MPTPEEWYKKAREILEKERKNPNSASPAIPKKGKSNGGK